VLRPGRAGGVNRTRGQPIGGTGVGDGPWLRDRVVVMDVDTYFLWQRGADRVFPGARVGCHVL